MRTKYKKIEFEFELPDGVKINVELVEENDECKGGGHSPEQGEEEKNK